MIMAACGLTSRVIDKLNNEIKEINYEKESLELDADGRSGAGARHDVHRL
jgi:hypothetical protein